jgi:peptidoglycan/LPS O-acetylase OafA/YrhL
LRRRLQGLKGHLLKPISFISLSRITSGGKFIPEIDGLRFVAIASVVGFHIYEYLFSRGSIGPLGIIGTTLLHGNRGVPLFFVISGFILGRPFAAHYLCGLPAPKLKEFYWRRLTRLEPPYLLAIIAVFVGLATFSSARGFLHLLASLIYSHNLIYGAPNPFYGLAWSLEIEFQFYFLIPLLTTVYVLPRVYRRVLMFALMFSGSFHLLTTPARFNLSIFGWIQCFAAGLLLADIYTDGWNPKQHWSFDLLSVALWPAVFLMTDTAAWAALPCFVFVLYVSAFRSYCFRKIFTFSAISTIGGMCYTIYLVHYPIISLVGRFFKSASALAIISLLSIAAVSLLFFVLIERPCMDKNCPKRVLSYLPMQKIKAE